MFPPIPEWDGLHPLIIHFPIALFLVAPLFVVLGMLWKKSAKTMAVTTLVLLLLATISSYVAVSTGKAAGELADRSPQISAMLEHHEEMGEQIRLIFTILTVAYSALLLLPLLLKKEMQHALSLTLNGIFIVLFLAGSLRVAQTAHLGGVLVHQLGVHAVMPPVAGQAGSQ
jgi:uncharacterized membrane protein